MRIKEFSIRRYGPLPDTGHVRLADFSLFFGENEDGKTLTIDGLVKLLFKRNRKFFERIERVNEDPEGYVIIEHEGREIKLPEKGDLTDITDINSQECRNIFVIRNSDLSIATESAFYTNVTDRLTGLRTEEILSIKSQLQELGKLTRCDSTASLRDVQGEKLKTRVGMARALIEEVEGLEGKVKEDELDRLEEDLLKLEEKESEINQQIETLEDARKREKYQQGRKAYEELALAQQELEKLKIYVVEGANSWNGHERAINGLQEEKEGLKNKVSTKKGGLEQKEQALSEKKADLAVLSERKRRIDDEIEPEIKNYLMGVGNAKQRETRNRFFTIASIASSILLAISIVGLIVNPSPVFYGLLVSFLISTGIFSALKFSFTREESHLAAVFERIKLAAYRFSVAAESVEGILANIQKTSEEHGRMEAETREAEMDVLVLKKEISINEEEALNIHEKIRITTEKIQNLSQEAGVGTLQEYNKKLKFKRDSEQSVETQSKILKSHFGSKGEQLQENLSYWLDEIDDLKEFESKANDITYDEKAVYQLKGKREELIDKKQGLEGKMAGFHKQLSDMEKKANDILRLEDDYLHCNTSLDMKAIKDRLSDFVAEVEDEKENALGAISIFEELEGEEEKKVSALFGKDGHISRYFREITNDLYQEAEFVIDDVKEVQVKFQDGSLLSADKLSGGAYDQLYLSIRLALGEKLLKGSKGFFVLDDPFIKADKERLERQLDILKRISESGWQIIYFTAKDEVRKLLEKDIDNGKVHYTEIQGIFSK